MAMRRNLGDRTSVKPPGYRFFSQSKHAGGAQSHTHRASQSWDSFYHRSRLLRQDDSGLACGISRASHGNPPGAWLEPVGLSAPSRALPSARSQLVQAVA